MEHKKPSKKILYILGLSVAGLFVIYYFVFSDIKAKNEHISALGHELSLQTSKREYMLSIQKIVSDAGSDIALVDNSIIKSDGDVSFIENLESIAKNNGLSITIDSLVFENDPALDKAGITIFKVKAKTSGSWIGTYKFLSQIESLPLKIKISNFGFMSDTSGGTSGTSKSSSGLWQSSFEIHILKYR